MKRRAVYALVFTILIISIVLVSSGSLDVNNDGVINITDLQILASHFQGKAAYNSSYDFNNNGKVDLFDLVSVARRVDVSNASNGSGGSSNRTVIFHSDWSTATGTTHNAVSDGGLWTSSLNEGNQEVITASSDSGMWPSGMANILHYHLNSGASNDIEEHAGSLFSTPAVGDSVYFRVYVRIARNETSTTNSNHEIEPVGHTCAYAWQWIFDSYSNGTWRVRIGTGPDGGPVTRWFPGGANLNQSIVYRLEWKFTKQSGTDNWLMDLRIYDDTGTLVKEGSDFTYSGTPLNAGTITIGDACINGDFTLGREGNLISAPLDYYWGGAAICDNNWCGPYRNGI